MSHANPASNDVNIVVLRGDITGQPTRRTLPSGGEVMQFDVQTRLVDGDRSATISSPVAVVDPSATTLADVTTGGQFVVVGRVKRRFFRVGGATQSRTEVVAEAVIPVRRRKQTANAIDSVIDDLRTSTVA